MRLALLLLVTLAIPALLWAVRYARRLMRCQEEYWRAEGIR